jgi:hypothetical protein
MLPYFFAPERFVTSETIRMLSLQAAIARRHCSSGFPVVNQDCPVASVFGGDRTHIAHAHVRTLVVGCRTVIVVCGDPHGVINALVLHVGRRLLQKVEATIERPRTLGQQGVRRISKGD